MRLFLFFFSLLIFSQLSLNGQFSEDFGDGELDNNPKWEGDISNFRVNEDFELQLNAPDAGTSFLYTQTDFPDSLRWSFKQEMDFAPSSSNKLRIYLAIDQTDLNLANGYYIEIGENGSADAINLYKLTAGLAELLGTATMGSLSTDPAFAEIVVEKTADNFWTVKAAYSNGDIPELEFDLSQTENLVPSNGYFGFECIYTSSRIEAFTFDDINIEELLPDLEPPVLTGVSPLSANEFLLSFSEAVDPSSILNLTNYSISELGNPDEVIFIPALPNELTIVYNNAQLESGTKYTLTVTGVTDLNGNEIAQSTEQICLLEEALPGDIVINEILFDPYQGGEDFVEIYNVSKKSISLSGLILSNDSKSNDVQILNTDLVLDAGAYLAISSDVDFLMDQYQPPASANLLNHAIPSMNNEDGNISISRIIDGVETSIDSFDYHEDMHFALLNDTEGVSLERLSSSVETNEGSNWHSASSSVNFATPGYENSNVILGNPMSEEVLDFESQVFSPNGDGDKDQLVMTYKLNEAGFIANIRIFDANGFLVRRLVNNELLSTQGFYTWDGLNESSSKKLPIGMYVVMYQFFNESGQVIEGKKVCVLADHL